MRTTTTQLSRDPEARIQEPGPIICAMLLGPVVLFLVLLTWLRRMRTRQICCWCGTTVRISYTYVTGLREYRCLCRTCHAELQKALSAQSR